MSALPFHPATLTWLILVGATAAARELGGDGIAPALSAAGVLLLSFAKLRLIVFRYMEVRCAPALLRHACDAWMLAAGGGIGFLYWRAL